MSRDYYAIIGVSSSATQKEISKAFRAQARKLHPDKLPPGASEATKQQAKKAFQELALAYEVLSDDTKRADYNLTRDVPSSNANRSTGAQAHARANPQSGGGNTGARSGPWFGEEEEDDFEEWKQSRDKQGQQEGKARTDAQHVQFGGLGGNWVKPTPPPKNGWSGWKQSGGEAQKRRADNDSDVSSTLSFDLRDLNLVDVEIQEDSGMAPAEVWTFATHDDDRGTGSGAQDASATNKDSSITKQTQPACCTVS